MQRKPIREQQLETEIQTSTRDELTTEQLINQREKRDLIYEKSVPENLQDGKRIDWGVMTFIFILAAALRFYKIDHPNGVVFDEVHFGKFASYYLRREFFFDVHPPLAKLILAFAGWVIGYDGHFEFDNIGDSYIENKVPYIGLRTCSVLFGSFIPVMVYAIMRESGYPRIIGLFSACLILFDNAHIVQTRLILLDAPLILFMTASFYSYIRFHKLRYSEFTKPWWTWMLLTGVFLSLTISCKMVGLFAFLTVGTAVLVDLWNMLDAEKANDNDYLFKHFAARVFGLIVVPAVVYLFWFWVHFAVLTKSGTGDDFMSPAFQQTLIGSPLTLNAEEIRYYDTIVMQHKNTKTYLHSHIDRYPLKYDDGRISSAGQQVTGYPHNDTNNHWIVEPTKELPETGRGRLVRHHDVITLRHVNTNTTLLTHDVACTTMATNTEFTTWSPPVEVDGVVPEPGSETNSDVLFTVEIDDAHEGQQWMTKSSHFQLIHVNTKVAMWTHTDPILPDWAYKQQEVNGNKKVSDRSTFWIVDEIVRDPNASDVLSQSAAAKPLKAVEQLNFFKKFFELQIAMLQHNAGLTDSHPYASSPLNWPFLVSGISFWTGPVEEKEQIYMVGNPISWWLSLVATMMFTGMLAMDQILKKRGMNRTPDAKRNRMYNSGGFFFIAWIYHYFPFFSMSRQLFLHHYLPAHLCSALVAGAVFHTLFGNAINYPISIAGLTTRRKPKTIAETNLKMIIGSIIVLILLLGGTYFLSPLTYGTPGLNSDQVHNRRILSSWTLHYAK